MHQLEIYSFQKRNGSAYHVENSNAFLKMTGELSYTDVLTLGMNWVQ